MIYGSYGQGFTYVCVKFHTFDGGQFECASNSLQTLGTTAQPSSAMTPNKNPREKRALHHFVGRKENKKGRFIEGCLLV